MSLGLELRKKRLSDLKKMIQTHEVMIHQALKADLGKSPYESYLTEVGVILEEIGFALKHLDSWAKPKRVSTPLSFYPGKSKIYPSPFGTVLVISPWNYPFQLCLGPVIGAVAAGNKVVIKPSEFAPETSLVIKNLIEKVFIDDEVKVVLGGVEETQKLLQQKFDYIFFTGSTEVGKIVMRAATENLTPLTLELGGKSPCLIEESANLDFAARRCAWGKFINAGQTCVAPDYVLVPKNMENEFISKLRFYIEQFYGEDVKKSEDYPRIINHKHFDRLKQLIQNAQIAIGGETDREDKFISPTVLKNVSWKDKVMEGEIFGPILPVISYDKLEDALKEIAARPKPLAFYLFSESRKMKEEIISKVSFGGGCINDTVVHLANPNLPFGGVGASGMGSYHGKKSFETFTHYKSIYERGPLDVPLRYPPFKKERIAWVKFFLN